MSHTKCCRLFPVPSDLLTHVVRKIYLKGCVLVLIASKQVLERYTRVWRESVMSCPGVSSDLTHNVWRGTFLNS